MPRQSISPAAPSQSFPQESCGHSALPTNSAVEGGRANLSPRPAWHRRPGESWQAWDRRMCAEKAAEYERKRSQPPMPLDPLYAGSLEMACGVGCFDCAGNAKGAGWW